MSVLQDLSNFIIYFYESRKNFYPCKLTGEYIIEQDNTIVVYVRNYGSRSYSYLPVKKIFADHLLLEKFCPHDVSRITLAALAEVLSDKNSLNIEVIYNLIHQSFNEIKKKGKTN